MTSLDSWTAAGAAGEARDPIRRALMQQRWLSLAFLHWPYEAGAVQRLLPQGLEVATYDGAAWVGLVPFFMHVLWPVPPVTLRFAETNVRTYVRDERGRHGVWFFSLDAARLTAVAVARQTYGLPYFWSDMRVHAEGPDVLYWCRRLWPGRPAHSRVRLGVGSAYRAEELTGRDHFLTARWVLFSGTDRRRLAHVWHPDWPLHRATVSELDDRLIAAAGLPTPAGDPLVHYSPGVAVRIGRPVRAT